MFCTVSERLDAEPLPLTCLFLLSATFFLTLEANEVPTALLELVASMGDGDNLPVGGVCLFAFPFHKNKFNPIAARFTKWDFNTGYYKSSPINVKK